MLLSEALVIPKVLRFLIKTFTCALQMKLISGHKFTDGTEIRQLATLKSVNVHCCLPPPDLLSSPSGILLFS